MLKIVFPELPPSSNHIYIKGTILSKQAREFAERFAQHVAQKYLSEVTQLDPKKLYAIHLRFFFPELVNKSFNNPQVAPSKRAKSRYKRIDLTNRIKLLEDCVRDALDIDDSQTFAASQEKHQDPQNPRVEIEIEQVDPELFGLAGEEPWGKV